MDCAPRASIAGFELHTIKCPLAGWPILSISKGAMINQSPDIPANPPPRRGWRSLALLNLAAGLILWVGLVTDLSWRGSLADVCYPFALLVLARFSLFHRTGASSDRRGRRWLLLACLPSLAGGGVVIAASVTRYIGILPALFQYSEWADERLIQSAPSPDGLRSADVYFRPVGAYAGGNGRVFVRLHYRWMPLIERDLLAIHGSNIDEKPQKYLEWRGNDTLFILSDDPAGRIIVGTLNFTGLDF